MDLNTIVGQYLISRTGNGGELQQLQTLLSDVPVDLTRLETALQKEGCDYGSTIITAELFQPQLAIDILGYLDEERAGDVESKLETPYPLITLDFSPIGERTNRRMREKFNKLLSVENGELLKPCCSGRRAGMIYRRNDKYRLVEFVVL